MNELQKEKWNENETTTINAFQIFSAYEKSKKNTEIDAALCVLFWCRDFFQGNIHAKMFSWFYLIYI